MEQHLIIGHLLLMGLALVPIVEAGDPTVADEMVGLAGVVEVEGIHAGDTESHGPHLYAWNM